MKKALLIIFVWIYLLINTLAWFAEWNLNKDIIKWYSIDSAKKDLIKYSSKWHAYVKAVDKIIEKYKDNEKVLTKLSKKINILLEKYATKVATDKNLEIYSLLVYLNQKIANCLLDTEDNNENELSTISWVSLKWTVTLDLNHPLVWKKLKFYIEMLDIDNWTIAETWSSIKVHYKGTLEDGTQFDSSYDRDETLNFTLWEGQMISWFEKAILGMKVWDKKSVTLSPEEAYGDYDPTKVLVVPKTNLANFVDVWYKLEVWEKLPTQYGELEIISTTDE